MGLIMFQWYIQKCIYWEILKISLVIFVILMVCVDDRYGMLFNRRRQSSDRKVTERICALCDSKKLWINSYSAALFPNCGEICIADDFLDRASGGDCCFVENIDVAPYMDRISKIVLFRWNKKYPADLYFPAEQLNELWRLERSQDFSGTSHDKITMEVYCR